jgi:hypothetical protein
MLVVPIPLIKKTWAFCTRKMTTPNTNIIITTRTNNKCQAGLLTKTTKKKRKRLM